VQIIFKNEEVAENGTSTVQFFCSGLPQWLSTNNLFGFVEELVQVKGTHTDRDLET